MLARITVGTMLAGLFICAGVLFLPLLVRILGLGPREVRFVLPANFHGAFIVVQDERGDDLQEVDGLLVVTVHPTRIARVRTLEPFAEMHKESWTTIDNRSIVHDANIGATDNENALRSIGLQSCGDAMDRLKYFLGTMHDAEAFDYCSIDVL